MTARRLGIELTDKYVINTEQQRKEKNKRPMITKLEALLDYYEELKGKGRLTI